MKYKIVIFDIGKTLLDKQVSPTISQEVLSDMKALQDKGIKVGVCTMRTINHCKQIIPFELDFYICLNGSYIVCDRTVIFDSVFKSKIPTLDYLSYGKDYAFYTTEKARQYALKNGFLINKQGVSESIYNLVLFDISKEEVLRYRQYNTEYWENTKTLVLQNADSSKILGIDKVLSYYRLNEPILYFGDGSNDLTIFQKYHDCVCMGNCYPPLEKYALFKTKTCEENGVSFALRKLNLL